MQPTRYDADTDCSILTSQRGSACDARHTNSSQSEVVLCANYFTVGMPLYAFWVQRNCPGSSPDRAIYWPKSLSKAILRIGIRLALTNQEDLKKSNLAASSFD